MRGTIVTVIDATFWMLLPLFLTMVVSYTAGTKLPGRPERDDMMPHGEMKKWMVDGLFN